MTENKGIVKSKGREYLHFVALCDKGGKGLKSFLLLRDMTFEQPLTDNLLLKAIWNQEC